MKLGLILLLVALSTGNATAGDVVVIGHPGLSKIDAATVQKIFTGKVIEIGGVAVTAVNAASGSPLRNRFLEVFLGQDEDKYTAYWTVRRFIGKGAPPKDIPARVDVIGFVQSTPGAIAYIDEADLKPGLNVLVRK